jgi:hypothetical protein
MESRPSLQHGAFHPAKRSLAYTGNPGLTLDKSPDPRIAFAQSSPTSLIALSRLCNQSVTPAVLFLVIGMKAQQQDGTDYRHDECRFLGFPQCCSRQCFGDLWSSFPRAHLSGWTASISAARCCQSFPGSSGRNCTRGFIASSETG